MQWLQKLKIKAKELKREAKVLIIAYKDDRTPFAAKILIAVTVGYLLSPIDLIPDFIPVLGILDDIIIVPALIYLSIKLLPADVVADARLKAMADTGGLKKNNWIFAAIIIFLWIAAIYGTGKWFHLY